MKKQKVSRRSLLLGGASLAASSLFGRSWAKRPNIILILTDDQARWACGAYGNQDIHTPNMDFLAENGALVEHCFVPTPVCSPSRASLLLSTYAQRHGIYEWISPRERIGIRHGERTFVQILQLYGYRTGLFGKWHLGNLPRHDPHHFGFDYFFGFPGGGNRPRDPTLWRNGRKEKWRGFLTDILFAEAMSFISNASEPFFCFISTRAPHLPCVPVPPEDMAPYQRKRLKVPEVPGIKRQRLERLYREYYASTTGVDRNLGRLLSFLRKRRLLERTFIVFLGDNGFMIGQHGLHTKGNAFVLGKRQRRPNMFDHSLLVPLLLYWPAEIRPGTRIQGLVSTLDLYPTILEAAGLAPPPWRLVEGKSLWPVIRGEKTKLRDKIFGVYDMHHGARAKMRMIRTEEWKLVKWLSGPGSDELYHLKSDPEEKENLSGSAPEKILTELTSELRNWCREQGEKPNF